MSSVQHVEKSLKNCHFRILQAPILWEIEKCVEELFLWKFKSEKFLFHTFCNKVDDFCNNENSKRVLSFNYTPKSEVLENEFSARHERHHSISLALHALLAEARLFLTSMVEGLFLINSCWWRHCSVSMQLWLVRFCARVGLFPSIFAGFPCTPVCY